ncbi:MAG TPA: MarR family transcriptional regulator [Actinomycetota bacterium]|nr:MarR family transcriptional regulator [Actinomycetota bacterium]
MSSRRELVGELTLALRELRGRLFQVNQSVGEHVGLGTIELEFIDAIARVDSGHLHSGAVTPGWLASASGLSPATVTGILDRLEKDGWIRRERDVEDRRKVLVHVKTERAPELFRLYSPMLGRFAAILKTYSDKELEMLLKFMRQVRDAGDEAVAEIRERAAT